MTLPDGYQMRLGRSRERALLLKYLSLSYQESFPQQQDFSHLAQTIEKYFSSQTPLWWVEVAEGGKASNQRRETVACLWLGNATDQVTGDRYAHIFLLYVLPAHRRLGIGTALMHQAQAWAEARGDLQIGLQVFPHNQPALNLYRRLGYEIHSLSLLKRLKKSF